MRCQAHEYYGVQCHNEAATVDPGLCRGHADADRLRVRVVQLEDAIRDHRETIPGLYPSSTATTWAHARLWSVLDDTEGCTHESVDTFGSGAGRRVDVCMACKQVTRFWNADTEQADG